MVKYFLAGFLYGILSEREIEERCADSNAYRWYLGIDLDEWAPGHSAISQLRRQKLVFQKAFCCLFEKVVQQYVEKGLVSECLAITDAIQVKANAPQALEHLVEMQEGAGNYWEQLDACEEMGLEEPVCRTGKRRGKRRNLVKKGQPAQSQAVSRTDPEPGHLNRPGKPRRRTRLHSVSGTAGGSMPIKPLCR